MKQRKIERWLLHAIEYEKNENLGMKNGQHKKFIAGKGIIAKSGEIFPKYSTVRE